MTPEEWKLVRPILESALELAPLNRLRFLDSQCPDDFVRREVESLIASHDQTDTNFLDAGSAIELSDELRFRGFAGKRIGPYEVIGEIAIGGMGAVYRAVRADGQYRQQVALKIVRAELGAELTASRFRNERQILASLNHPNIARILDGGTTADGLPYFVMEFIDGLPITDYCDDQRLSVNARLNLFRSVCSAVYFAHQHLVIHRDIKPSNILIVEGGLPKLLDFGIAKILDSALIPDIAAPTEAGLWLMTPEYASPEQFQGHSITTATDVYSLGLVLYELLTGHPAHRFKSRLPHEIARSVLESEPERPSIDIWRKEGVGKEEAGKVESTLEFVSSRRKDTPDKLRRRLAGDLDNIVMKAIRKEPDQRYASVDQLSEDLRRYLEGLPVQARRSTVGYRCQKYVLRHKVAVAAGALLALSLSTGMVLTLYEAHIAQVNAVRAEKRFNDVRKLANSLLFDIHDRVRDLPGSTEARQAIVRSALEYLDSLSQEAGNDTGLQRELAMAYERVGDVQGNPYYANLGNVSGALANYRKSLAIRQHLLASDSQNVTLQRNLSASYNKIGVALEGLENYSEALASYREAATILERLSKKSTDPMMLDQLAGAYFYVANAARGSGDLKLALESAQRAVSVRQTIQTNVPAQETAVETHSAGDHAGLASIFSAMNDFDSALAERRKSIAIMKSLSQQNPHDPTIQSFLGQGEFGLARTLISMGKTNKALEALGKAKSIFDLLLSLDPVNAFAREQLALIYQTTGYLKAQIGNRIAGLADLKVSIAMLELIETTRTGDALALSDFAVSYDNVGRVYTQISEDAKAPVAARAKNLGEACRAFEQSASKWSELRARGPLNESYQQQFERTKKSLASCNDSLAKLSANARFRELK